MKNKPLVSVVIPSLERTLKIFIICLFFANY